MTDAGRRTLEAAWPGGELPPVIASRYRVLGELGRGSMGQVLRVEHVHTGEQLALKVLFARKDLRGDFAERFKREARAWTLIRSEHVVRTIDAGTAPELDGAPFLVMELLDGVDLEEHLARVGKLGAEAVVALMGHVSRGLHRAHALGMVHRDLKPANLFLHAGEGRVTVKILDFGLLKVTGQQETNVTAPGLLLGTPLYMAPEQVRGHNDAVGPAADVWALGMVVFQLLTGERYWSDAPLPDMLASIVASEMPKPSARAPWLDQAFDAWFLRSCERDPAARWPSIVAQWKALGAALLPAGAADGADLDAFIPASAVRRRDPAADGVSGPHDPTVTLIRATAGDEGAGRRPASASSSSDGERRQVTVMFFAPAARGAGGEMDPEEVAEVMRAFDHAAAEALGGADGAQSHIEGTGRYVYFGYPRAHGNDAVRAVAAALAIVEATKRLAPAMSAGGTGGVSLTVRVGIHSGLVLAANMAEARAESRAIVGAAPSIAAEIERMAPPNGVLVSAATHRLVRGSFECRPLGARNLAAASTDVFEVTGRAADADPSHATPFIGRDAELEILVDRWERVSAEGGQVALLSGEAGIGKSRCVAAFKDELSGQGVRWLACQCSPHFANRAFYPIIELASAMIQSPRGDAPPAREARLRDFLRGFQLAPDAPAILASLLAIPLGGTEAPLNLTPQRQRQLTEQVLLALLQGLGDKEPLCLVIEDLHWADPSTLELLSLLVDQAAGMRLFTLLTSRPDLHPPWGTRAHVTQVNLVRLPRKRAEAMVRALPRGRDLPPRLVDQIVDRTDGIPLFIEELTRMMIEAPPERAEASGSLSHNIPSSLRESLTARLDRLGRAKGTAQLAAVIGHRFAYDLLAILSPLDGPTLEADLARLVESDLVLQRGVPPGASYAFKHSLVQEAAYESLVKNARRQAHARLSEALSTRPGVEPELLAHHLAAGGLPLEAAGQLMRAAQGALQRSANVEAKNQLDRAISLIESQPESPMRNALQLSAHALLGVPLFSTRGYGAPEVEQTYARAAELAARIHGSDSPELFQVLWGLWIFHLVRARYHSALGFAARLFRLAERTPDSGLRLAALVARANTEFFLGEGAASRDDFEQALSIYDPAAHRHYAYACGQDLSVQARSMESWTLWMLGYPDQALTRAREAVDHASGLSHPSSLGFALAMKMVTHQYRREAVEAEETSRELIALSQAQGLVHWLGPAILSHGWAVRALGRPDEGLDEMRRGREMFGQVGALIAMSFHDALLLEACGQAGHADEFQRRLDLVRPVVEGEERVFEPEVLRVEGEIRRSLGGDPGGAEALFLRAFAAAERMGARSLALRTALSLARLLRDQGRGDEGRVRVEQIYTTFTEGFDTGDLREARALLAGGA